MVMVEGRCPACGGKLHLEGNRLACMASVCPRPTAAHEILNEPQRQDHIVSLGVDYWSVKHPLIERLTGDLMGHCGLADHVIEFGRDWFKPENGGLLLDTPYRMWVEGGSYRVDYGTGTEHDSSVQWEVDEDGKAVPYGPEGP
jgi:hypothetical protein